MIPAVGRPFERFANAKLEKFPKLGFEATCIYAGVWVVGFDLDHRNLANYLGS